MIMTYLAVLLYPFVYKAKSARHRNKCGRGKFVGDFSMGRGKFVGDFDMGNIICANFTSKFDGDFNMGNIICAHVLTD